MKNKKLLSVILGIIASTCLWAQGPNESGTYYKPAHGKSGEALKTALYQIVKQPSIVPYDSLWKAYTFTDMSSEGILLDMYSNTTAYTDPTDKSLHKNSSEGSGINREHSMPKSWFNPTDTKNYTDIKPMFSDVVHVIPTDGYINNMRSDLPYGQTTAPSKSSNNQFSKVGPCSVEGYSGTIFEPADEYKGDLARIYFYMATCYEPLVATWTSAMLGGTAYQPFSDWSMPMLMQWAQQDPVSEKEIVRNASIWKVQGNRNPFVDYPGLEQYVWGDKTTEAFSYDGSDASTDPAVQSANSTEIALNKAFFGASWTGTRAYWDRSPLTGSQDGITIIYAYGCEGSNMYLNDQQMRLYTNNTLTFSTDEDEMTCIELNIVQNDKNRVFTASTGQMDGYTWTGKAREVQFQLEYASVGVVRLNKAKIQVSSSTGIEQMAATHATGDGRTYNLMGVAMTDSSLRPGIYIRNGKKFVVKP